MDNTVGSLTKFQKSVVIGTLLGDGYIRKLKGRSNAFLEINHSIKQKDYVDWKYKTLHNVVKSIPKERSGNQGRVAYRFFTRQSNDFSEIHNLFYENGSKIIPNIQLNPVILAVWFMDDGSKCSESDFYLNTQQFDLDSQNRALKLLNDLGLEARLNKDKQYKRIRFLKKSIPKLIKIIKPYIIPSMEYKI